MIVVILQIIVCSTFNRENHNSP